MLRRSRWAFYYVFILVDSISYFPVNRLTPGVAQLICITKQAYITTHQSKSQHFRFRCYLALCGQKPMQYKLSKRRRHFTGCSLMSIVLHPTPSVCQDRWVPSKSRCETAINYRPHRLQAYRVLWKRANFCLPWDGLTSRADASAMQYTQRHLPQKVNEAHTQDSGDITVPLASQQWDHLAVNTHLVSC